LIPPGSCANTVPLPAHISIIIPVLNEASRIGELVRRLRSLDPLEIIVADASSTDGTTRQAETAGARVVNAPACRGVQLNSGARAASGDILLFLHADVSLGESALAAITQAVAGGAAGGNLDIHYQGGWEARVFSSINRARRRFHIFYGDSGIFCRRDVFEQLGGYQPWPVLEDYEFSRRLSKAGRLALLGEPIYVSDRRWARVGIVSTLWSWFWIQALYLAGVSPHRLAGWYKNVR
jgi:rSAM/selenodomain-associated transferase 2